MSLRNPAALWLLLLVLVPLLLSRSKPRVRHVVSNVYLWREAVRRAGGRVAPRRVRLTWLVLVQMTCLGAMVFSLAGPVVSLEGGLTVFVFDVSASMAARDGGATRLDAARARARSIVRALPRFARVRLILATASPRQAGQWAASDPLLLAAIDALAPTAGTADVTGAMELAVGSGDVDNIIVFGDTDVAIVESGRDSPAVQIVRVGSVAENAAVTRVAVRERELGGRAGQALVTLRNYGSTLRAADVEVSVDGRIVHRQHVQLLPAVSQTLNVELPDVGHFVTARLVGNDALSLDDLRSVGVPLANAIRVALLGPRGSFLERALEVNPSVSLRTYGPDGTLQEIASTEDFDVVVCDRCRDSDAEIPSLVITRGGGEPIHDVLRVVSTDHPLADALESGKQIATAGSSTATADRADVVLRVGSAPAVTASERDGQRRVDIHLDLTEPDFVVSAAFPLLVANAVGWLAAQYTMPSEVIAGEPLAFRLATTAANMVRVLGPDGSSRDVRRTGGLFIVADTEAAGQYRIHVDGSERLVAVNPNVEAESNLSAAQGASFNRTGNATVSVRAPISVARWLVLLSVGLLAMEWRIRLHGA
ncbi:MAG: VWA domain-containing protein [Vicinamibacterales bacterium]